MCRGWTSFVFTWETWEQQKYDFEKPCNFYWVPGGELGSIPGRGAMFFLYWMPYLTITVGIEFPFYSEKKIELVSKNVFLSSLIHPTYPLSTLV